MFVFRPLNTMFNLILLPSCYLSQLCKNYVKHKFIISYSGKINKTQIWWSKKTNEINQFQGKKNMGDQSQEEQSTIKNRSLQSRIFNSQ